MLRKLLLKKASILDVSNKQVLHGHIVISGEKNVDIVHDEPENYPGKRIDLTNKWVLPGFHDMHVHAWGNPSPKGDDTTEVLGSSQLLSGALLAVFDEPTFYEHINRRLEEALDASFEDDPIWGSPAWHPVSGLMRTGLLRRRPVMNGNLQHNS